MNTNVITALGMCKVCTEAIHSVARKRQDWTCESTCEHETRKPENVKTGGINLWTRKTAKTRKRRKQENRENGENAKTAKTRKRENGENDENPKTAKSVPVFWFSMSRFLVFSVFSVFWFSRFLVFSFRWPHPSGQVAFFMCLARSCMCQSWSSVWRRSPCMVAMDPAFLEPVYWKNIEKISMSQSAPRNFTTRAIQQKTNWNVARSPNQHWTFLELHASDVFRQFCLREPTGNWNGIW